MAMNRAPSEDATAEVAATIAFAESLAKSYAARGGNVTDLLPAFAGIVAECDLAVSGRALIAVDRHLSGGGDSRPRS